MKVVEPKSKIAAAILAIVFPYLGIHGFYLGNVGLGLAILITSIICTILTVVSLGLLFFITVPIFGIIHITSIVQGILYLCSTDYDFNRKYVAEKRWF